MRLPLRKPFAGVRRAFHLNVTRVESLSDDKKQSGSIQSRLLLKHTFSKVKALSLYFQKHEIGIVMSITQTIKAKRNTS